MAARASLEKLGRTKIGERNELALLAFPSGHPSRETMKGVVTPPASNVKDFRFRMSHHMPFLDIV